MINILVAEDHGVVRAGLVQILETKTGFKVSGMAESGAQALSLLEKDLPVDILLTDLHLGDITGIELATRARKQRPDLKVIILTMETHDQYVSDAFSAGINGYIFKETLPDELLVAIKKVNEGKRFICTGVTEKLSQRLSRERNFTGAVSSVIELSSRESEILYLLSDGFTNIEIAERLFTSRRTVEGHRQSLINKTGVRNTPELIKYAIINGLLRIGPK